MPRGRKPKEAYSINDVNPQLSLMPEHDFDYVKTAVERVKIAWGFHHNMNPDGRPMLLAFSGGKDSICLFFVCKRASEELGIPMEKMFHVQYNITTVDPPELVQFIRELKKTYPFIVLKHPKKNMWQLIEKEMFPPTQKARYCCEELKESASARGEYTLTGVRRAESPKRANREEIEIRRKGSRAVYLGDNVEEEREIRYCMKTESYICNPIIDWSDEDVWKFIKHENLPYCKLYDEGFSRLGCIGCPMASKRERERQFARWPGYEKCYKRAFQRMVETHHRYEWKTGEEVFDWWMNFDFSKTNQQPEKLFEEVEDD